jgi:SAM-dependent methyltransferase
MKAFPSLPTSATDTPLPLVSRPLFASDSKTVDPTSRAATWDFTDEFARLERTYQQRKRPIAVNFRRLVQMQSGVDRATHLLHSYPAKLLANIPIFFLNCAQLQTSGGGLVVDPFCGTGTVLLEALLAGNRALGADANPLARLIATAKLSPLGLRATMNALERVRRRFARARPAGFTPVVDVDLWFEPQTQQDLGRLLSALRKERKADMRRFLEACFSNCLRKASLADPRMSVPVRAATRPPKPDVFRLFERSVRVNAERLQYLQQVDLRLLKNTRILTDAKKLAPEGQHLAVDLVITSPPYLGAQKYIRASSLSIGWLGLAPENKLRALEKESIGREHFLKHEYSAFELDRSAVGYAEIERLRKKNPLRAYIAATYLREMKVALEESCRHLRPGGHFVLVIGDNSVCGSPFRTSRYLRSMLETAGLALRFELIDEIRSRGLMTKRNKTAGLISREHIFVFQK